MDVVCLEYATGGGGYEDSSLLSRDNPFLREGTWMLTAVVEDWLACPGVNVRVLTDPRVSLRLDRRAERVMIRSKAEMVEQWSAQARDASYCWLLAPECGGVLERLTELVQPARGRLLCPDAAFVRLASDKQATAEYLARGGVPVSEGIRLAPGASLPEDWRYPAVLKPVDGAGSTDVRLIPHWHADARVPNHGTSWRLERFCPGKAASVLVCGTLAGHAILPASWQHLSADGQFRYGGGTTPIPEIWDERARELALRAAACLPTTRGYFGLDVVLGEACDGSDDVVIEVNPRLTTSYIGVRRVVAGNLMFPLLDAERSGEERFSPAWCARRHGISSVSFGLDSQS